MYIYVDVVFCVNIIMNTVILLATAWLARISYVWWRVLLASAWGAAYVIGGVVPQLALFYTPVFKVVLSFSIIWAAFGLKTWKALLLQIVIFYIASFILGGAIMGWLFFLYSGDPFTNINKLPVASWTSLACGSILCLLFIVVLTKFVLNRMLRQRTLYQAEVRYKDKCVAFTAMLDTGNALYTILGRRPVVLINQTTVEKIMDDSVVSFMQDCPADRWIESLDVCEDDVWLSRVQIIPYRAVGNNSLLLGFRPDGLVIKTKSGRVETDNVVLGVYQGVLSNNDMYQALLHPAILKV